MAILGFRRTAFAAAAALTLLGTPAPLVSQERPLSALDLYHLRTASSVVLTPDGSRAIYLVSIADSASNSYKRDFWSIETRAGAEPRRLTTFEASGLGAPAISPDGNRLAFVRNGQIWILEMSGPSSGDVWQLTRVPTGAGNPTWSPDGRRMAFTSALSPEQLNGEDSGGARADRTIDAGAIRNIHEDRASALREIRAKLDRNAREHSPRVVTRLDYLGETAIQDERYSQIFLTEVERGAEARRLTSGMYGSGSPAFSPDGLSLVYAAGPPGGDWHPDYERESDLFVLTLSPTGTAATGAPRRISEPGFSANNPAFSPDGAFIAYSRRIIDTPFPTAVDNELIVMRADGSERRSVTGPMDRGINSYTITRDGWLYFTVSTEGSVPLFRTRLNDIRPQPVIQGPLGVLSFDVAGSTVAWSQMSPSHPSDVYAAGLDGRSTRRLTALNDALLAQVYVGDYEEIWYPSFDGTRIQAWYIRPIGFQQGQRYPLAVQIHGGPHAMWGPGEASMWLEYQMLAGAGYTVFLSNPRGSGGYGEAGLQSIHRDWGTSPGQDILIGADSVIARGLADASRQVVTGGSYAGFMTAWLIAHEAPERFSAAVAARGVYDLAGWYGSSNTWRLFEGEFGTRPWEDPEITREQSPLTHVANIQTPLLLLHADTDFRTTIATAEALYRAMKVLDKEVEFVRYPREGHELTRSGEPRHRVDHMLRTLEYFERWVR